MDIKSWILLVGTLLIIAVICHGFWTAYLARKNDVRMDIETDIPEDDLGAIETLREELPNGGARVTPTFGFESLIHRPATPALEGDLFAEVSDSLLSQDEAEGDSQDLFQDPVKTRLKDTTVTTADSTEPQIALDDAVAFAAEGFAETSEAQEGNADAGYEPEQATLDLDTGALEERYAARVAAAQNQSGSDSDKDANRDRNAVVHSSTPLLTDAEATPTAQLPPKKLIAPEQAAKPRRKQFEPPSPQEKAEIEAQRERERERVEAAELQAARERAERELEELEQAALEAAAREQAEREAAFEAKVEAQRVARLEQQEREAQAKLDAQARADAKAQAKARAEKQAQEQALADQQRRAQALQARQEAEAAQQAQELVQQHSLQKDRAEVTGPIVEFTESASGRGANTEQPTELPPAEELVVLNVVAKTRSFHGGDVLELFLRNGIKFGDMNIFHRIDPISKASQYSIASLTEPGFFDLQKMESQEFRGLCLFMQLPCVGQPTKVFTDMLTVADKLASQLDAEVCDEQFNRLTRQSTEHFRQRVAEFTRRQMSKRA